MEPVSREDVESEVATNLDEEKLLTVLGTLPPQHRHLFLLRYQHDLSYEEIAQVMDQPVTTIKSMLFRVRTKVRALVNKDAVEVSNLRSEA
jgi:RNA polymerase sigma-70 factor (ECF subfamily)